MNRCGGAGVVKRGGLKNRCSKSCAGSSPAPCITTRGRAAEASRESLARVSFSRSPSSADRQSKGWAAGFRFPAPRITIHGVGQRPRLRRTGNSLWSAGHGGGSVDKTVALSYSRVGCAVRPLKGAFMPLPACSTSRSRGVYRAFPAPVGGVCASMKRCAAERHRTPVMVNGGAAVHRHVCGREVVSALAGEKPAVPVHRLSYRGDCPVEIPHLCFPNARSSPVMGGAFCPGADVFARLAAFGGLLPVPRKSYHPFVAGALRGVASLFAPATSSFTEVA